MGAFDAKTSGGLMLPTNYIQTPVSQSSGRVYVPPNTVRIEALLCGGGGAGGSLGLYGAGGGFGGLSIFELPLFQYFDVVVGAGAASVVNSSGPRGGTTTVGIGVQVFAAVGGGGSGGNNTLENQCGLYGGGGGGLVYASTTNLASGGAPFPGKLLWAPFPVDFKAVLINGMLTTPGMQAVPSVAQSFIIPASANVYGGGGGGAYAIAVNGGFITGSASYGGGGAFGAAAPGSSGVMGGGGGGSDGSTFINGPGGSLSSISIWGLTGFAGGLSTGLYGGNGGGGMLSAGATTASSSGGAGGNGGGGGGGGCANFGPSGAGGNGFIVFRFYF